MGDRHTFRADWHNYNEGLFFVTICCDNKKHYLGEIENGRMLINDYGYIAQKCLKQIPAHHDFQIEILHHVIMPNHIHVVIYLGKPVGAQNFAPGKPEHLYSESSVVQRNVGALKLPEHRPPRTDNHFNSKLAVVIRTFKAAVTREIRTLTESNISIWQRNYYEHIIRTQSAFDRIMLYIDTNVENWASDRFYLGE